MNRPIAHIAWRCLVIPAIAILWLPSRSKAQFNKDFQRVSIDDQRLGSVVLAKVGDNAITAQEFLLSYEYGPAFTKREKDSRKRYLDFMIYEKLLALAGYAQGGRSRPDVQNALAEIEADLATEELYKEDVLKRARVSVEEIHDGVLQERIHRTVKWIYSHSKEHITQARHALEAGASFDSMFARQLSDSLKADDRTMETTMLRVKIRNPLFARVLASLPPKTVSMPIQGPDGWYLVKVVEGWSNAIVTESENAKLREDVRRALVQHKSDSLSDEYVKALMTRRHPVIQRETFEVLHLYLARIVLPAQSFISWNLADRMKRFMPGYDTTQFNSYQRQPLIKMNQGKYTLADFLRWYKPRETAVRLAASSPISYFHSLENLVWRMVRDRLLTERAYARKLQKRERVVKEKKWWEEKLMYQVAKARIVDSIPRSDSLLSAYFEKHRASYKTSKGDGMDSQPIKEEVWKNYHADEFTRRMLHEILQLKQKYGVSVDEQALKEIPVDVENLPKTIDVYTVKVGGILPRPAFPTIDYDWQTWN